MKNIIPCELCKQEATLYCAADSAFLCNPCDARIHGANFLVARHIRQPLYVSQDVDDDPAGPLSSSSSSACISTTESAVTKRSRRNEIGTKKGLEFTVTGSSSGTTEVSSVEGGSKTRFGKRRQNGPPCKAKYSWMADSEGGVDRKVEGVFRSWCRRILGDEGEREHEEVVAAALRGVRLCMGVLPMRVALAAAFWAAFRKIKGVCSPMPMSMLERVEDVCGVPVKLIVAAERRVARIFRTAATGGSSKQKGCHHQFQEGWGES